MKNCSPWEGPTLEQFVEDCLHGRDLTLDQGQNVGVLPPRRKEQQRQSVMN